MATNEDLLELYGLVRRRLSVVASALLKETGLGTRQFIILKALARQGEVTVTELVDMSMTDPGTISRSVAQLKEAGLVDKHQSKKDGRVWTVKLTKKGQAQIPKIHKVYSELSDLCFAKLKTQEKRDLATLLEHVANRLQDAGARD